MELARKPVVISECGAEFPGRRRVGLELEFPVVNTATGRGMDRDTAERLWRSFAAQDPSWSTIRESVTGSVTGVRRTTADGAAERVDTDTGVCTVELALGPQRTITAALAEADTVLRDLQRLLDRVGHTLLCTGTQPLTWFDPTRKTRKDWYLLLTRRWRFHHWMVPIASHQVSVDVTPREAVRAVNVLCGLAGLFVALTASSPIARGARQPWKETRNWVWHERSKRIPAAEAAYTSNAMPPAPFPDTGSYLSYCWDSPIFFLTDLKSNGYELCGRTSFTRFLLSREPVIAREWDGTPVQVTPNRDMLDRIHQYGWHTAKLHYRFDAETDLGDVRAAVTSGWLGEYFEDHAVDCYVENRACGVAPDGEEGVAAALTLGVIERLDDAEQLLRQRDWAQWRRLWIRASEQGLSRDDPETLALARDLVGLAVAGLRARGRGEERYLDPVCARIEQCRTPADDMITAFTTGGTRKLISAVRRSS